MCVAKSRLHLSSVSPTTNGISDKIPKFSQFKTLHCKIVGIHIYIYIHTYTYLYIYDFFRVLLCLRKTYGSVEWNVRTSMYVCMYVYMYIYACVCVCVCLYVYIMRFPYHCGSAGWQVLNVIKNSILQVNVNIHST